MNLRQIWANFVRRFKKYTPEILMIEGGIIVMFILGSCFYQVDTFMDSACGNEVDSKSFSPDKKWEVVLFNRSCGATTGYSTEISILKAGEKLPNENGNIFTGDNESRPLTITWKGNDLLEISGTKGMDIFKKEDDFAFGTVQIHYK